MKNLPSLSIIIPSYNQGRYIERTILSILKQDYPGKLEVIVSDGGSEDETVDILEKYPQIKWWSEPDKGFVDAVMKGVASAEGEIMAIQSSDDFYLKDALKISVEELVNDDDVAIVAGCDLCLKSDMQTIHGMSALKSQDITPDSLLKGSLIPQHCAFFYRSVMDKVGGLRKEVDTCADIDFWYRALHFYKGKSIPYHTAVYQLHSEQRTKVLENWGLSIMHMIESCEKDTVYSSLFKFSAQEKRDLYATWDLFFKLNNNNKKQNKEKYVNKINSILESDEYTKITKEKIYNMGVNSGLLERDSYFKKTYKALIEGSLIHKLNNKLLFLHSRAKKNVYRSSININWWQ